MFTTTICGVTITVTNSFVSFRDSKTYFSIPINTLQLAIRTPDKTSNSTFDLEIIIPNSPDFYTFSDRTGRIATQAFDFIISSIEKLHAPSILD